MNYYVVSDIHGYYSEMLSALSVAGYFSDSSNKKIIICGDLFDRGQEACKLQAFVVDLLQHDAVVLIRGNHEDLMLDLLSDWWCGSYRYSHHKSNGTLDTALQLTGFTKNDLATGYVEIGRELLHSPLISKIIPSMVNYYETANYIFVHGWIPFYSFKADNNSVRYEPFPNWRQAVEEDWFFARWGNGMAVAHNGVLEEGKTIVCGHWHCSFGHARYESKGPEHGEGADYSPYYGKGIIAIDACTARSHKVNCLVLKD